MSYKRTENHPDRGCRLVLRNRYRKFSEDNKSHEHLCASDASYESAA
jgi:hypothetical protein